ncbi:MAG: dihydrolipoamide acyltransferase [Candidatus Rokuibacteriota bacterium]|nr:MAG: dihydrolipoamide acyltransferase [Candidatus Rokubacteria bacterium]
MAITKVVMPKLSEAMESGKIIKWLKKEGDRVQAGDILAEVETDKADVEMEAFGGGVLRKILAQAGEKTPVGALIGVIAEPSDDISALLAGAPAPAAAPAAAPGPPGAPVVAPIGAAPSPAVRTVTRPEPAPTAAVPAGVTAGRVKASPLAKKIAAQSGVDLRLLQGTGPGGRIIRRDVEQASTRGVAAMPAATAPAVAGPEYEDRPLSPIRATIAKRMPLSKAPVPHFYVTSEVAMDRAWELREELNALEDQPKISINDFVVRATALTLMKHPEINASFQGDAVRVWRRAHIGIAVALEDGLITPVLRDCQAKSLAQIAVEARALAERTRARKLRATELSGATFSISNLGMFDVAEFSAIINPPEGAILAVGSVRRVPVVEDAGLGVGRRMMLTLSCDHRVMDGAMGARFLQDLKQLLEAPLRLLV